MPSKKPSFFWPILLVLAACGEKSATDLVEPSAPGPQRSILASEEAQAGRDSPATNIPAAFDRKLIRQASLSLRVDSTDDAATDIRRLVAEADGYVAEVSSRLDGELRYYNLTLRLPGESLDSTLQAIRELADEVTSEHIGTQDVTSQFVDLEARLKSLTATETELRELLAESRERQHDAEDIMAIYRHLTEIRTQVETLQGQMNLLSNQIDYATVRVDLAPTESAKPVVARGWRPLETVRDSVRQLIANLSTAGDVLIRFVIAVLPIIAVLGVVLWLVLRMLGRFSAGARSQRKG